ncbi:MAG: hypothetical protein FD166_2314 [Bacteroidetes bacterium]|nr:MAG: hypothetical protein FD166_2314 [Bacteroidota bacterium]
MIKAMAGATIYYVWTKKRQPPKPPFEVLQV